jgi:hypothetical protein
MPQPTVLPSLSGAEALMRYDTTRRLKEMVKYNRHLGLSPTNTTTKRKRSVRYNKATF